MILRRILSLVFLTASLVFIIKILAPAMESFLPPSLLPVLTKGVPILMIIAGVERILFGLPDNHHDKNGDKNSNKD